MEMDEVNADDLNELESRLYAQIHHEKAANGIITSTTETTETAPGHAQQAETVSRVHALRYWVRGSSNAAAQGPPAKSKNLSISHISTPKRSGTGTTSVTSGEAQHGKGETDNLKPLVPHFTFHEPQPRNTHELKNRKQRAHLNADIRINPLATAKQNKKQRQDRQQHKVPIPPIPPNILKDGPFAKKAQKLEKAIRIVAKRQKTKLVQNKRKLTTNTTETIVLHSSDESDCDDVILVPIPVPLTISIDDSDEEEKETFPKSDGRGTEMLKIDENAVDAADVEMDCSSFMKPQPTATNSNDKRVENSSRCTSPCSVLSSDDFIGQNDRSRLLETGGPADDEDLLVLTANVGNSEMESPRVKEIPTKEGESRETFVDEMNAEEESSIEVECLDFVEPTQASTSKNNYRVEQPQFRALDVYESESDTVYSKGTPKPTIIRSIGGSSGEEEPAISNQKLKRLRKRRASGSQKETDTINEEESSNSESEDENNGGFATGVPFICHGPAVERCKTRTRKSSLSAKSRRASTGGCASGQMCDSEFIATLNTLVQGGDNENSIDAGAEDDVDSDMEDTPTAREIAEKVLEQNRQKSTTVAKGNEVGATQKNVSGNMTVILPSAALPDDALTELDKVFETIDQLEQPTSRVTFDDSVQVDSDTSDSNSGPEPEVQVVSVGMQSPTDRASVSMPKRDSGDPVYNVIYSRGSRFSGSLGWNDEMRRFYNNSWNGENFNLRDVWQKLNPNKKLWKIYTEDRFPKERRYSNLKCNNCCEFGHIRAKCKRPKKASICYMCGERGHYEPRCPNTICLRCGNKTHIFTKSCNSCTFQNRLICPLCKVRGHTLNYCPDKWRRYHSTTETNAYPNCQIEYKTKKYCCICGKRGHLSETCRSAVRFQEYPIIVSEVKSHQKSYSDLSMKTLQTGIAFNLLYKPSEDYSFELAEGTTGEKYYGRFLKATGMGYMLRRKRRLSATVAPITPAKQSKSVAQQYNRNPYLKAGATSRSDVQDVPDQVQEITESGNLDNHNVEMQADTVASSNNREVEAIEDEFENESVAEIITEPEEKSRAEKENATIDGEGEFIMETATINEDNEDAQETAVESQMTTASEAVEDGNNESSSFKTPPEICPTRTTSEQQSRTEAEPLPMDSDSNYSFSEHFELPQQSKAREMDPLPDYIPLGTTDDADTDEIALQVGISRNFVTAETDDDESGSPLPDLPCEAKIYLTHFHSKYLLSPAGHAFLVEKSKACNIKARLHFTTVGHVLMIFGLPSNQDNFHRELLLKYRELTDQMNRRRLETYQKVPKRTDVLIRFLRENVNQLFANLGNVNELLKRLKYLENQNSKTGWKSADKTRRSLNMILLGQAGLSDGDLHLDKLLLSLKTLINDYKSEDNASNELRNEIDCHWKTIFTSYRHNNYPELVQNYNRLVSKNRIPKLNIDPLLLGNKVLDVSLTGEQKERLQQQKPRAEATPPAAASKHSRIVLNPLNPKNSKLINKKYNTTQQEISRIPNSNCRSGSPPPPAPSMKIKPISHSSNKSQLSFPVPLKGNQQAICTPNVKTKARAAGESAKMPLQPPSTKPDERSAVNKVKQVATNWQSTCDNLLTGIDSQAGELKKGLVRVSKGPSMFWSRECVRYLDECIKLAESNSQLLEKLQRVQKKSTSGSLSYNDYRAVIKLHSTMLGK